MDIDKLFQLPKFSGGGSKRKFPDAPTPDMLKKLKLDSVDVNVGDTTVPPTNSRRATVEDDDNDFAPGGDADYFAEEDEDGRFFGGGLTSEQKDILNIFEKAGGEGVDEVEGLSLPRIRKLLVSFERAVDKNHDQRSKYPDDPSRFIDSEADLDAAIKSLLPLSQAPSISYPEIVRSGLVKLLVGLLTHDNVDIVIDVVELVHELTDEDAEVDQESEEHKEAPEAVNMLINNFVENSILELLVDNLSRLNEDEESDRQGVFHVLGIFENFVSLIPSLAAALVSKTTVMQWLLKRIQSEKHDENCGYAAELLSILLQTSVENKNALAKYDGVETLLKVLSQYRKRNPLDADETEFMENLFDALCSALSEPSIKQLFLNAEGPDLMILMIKDRMEAKSRCVKVLDYAMSGPDGAPVCNAFVEALGLKTIFTALMGKTSKRSKAKETIPASDDVAHSLGIISSLLTNLPADSNSRLRLLAKFVDNEYEKIEKLIEIREAARNRLKDTDLRLQEEKQDIHDDLGDEGLSDMQNAFYLQRLEGGLFTLQMVDYILAWVVVEDDGIRTHTLRMLDRNNQGMHNVLDSLRLYEEHADDDFKDGEVSQREILKGLISALATT